MLKILRGQNLIIKTVTAVIVTVLLGGCGYFGSSRASEENTTTPPEEAVTITVGRSQIQQIPDYIQATGSMVADEVSNVAPKVAGRVADVAVNVGQFVTQGSVVARIDDRDARLRLAAAQASLKQAEASVRQAEARLGLATGGSFNASAVPEVRSASASYEEAQAELRQAEANEKRYRELVETGDVAMVAYEQYRLSRDTARTRVAVAKQQLETQLNLARQNNQAIRSAEASVEAARAQINISEQDIVDTIIRAPFSGFVSEKHVAVGEFVSTANHIITLLRTSPIKIQIQIAESDVPSIVLGRSVSIEVDAYRDRRFSGVVTAVNPAVDQTSRSAIVEASIDNAENLLRTGMFATARISKEGGSSGIFIPKSAVYNHQATQSFRGFVIEDGIAKLRVLQLGTEEGDNIQILDGIAADEMVATSALDQLYEGAKVVF